MFELAIAVKRAIVFALVWIVLAGLDPASVIVGVPVVLAATWLSVTLVPITGKGVRLIGLIAMLPGFLWRSLLGGIDVARRAFDPRLPVSPRWIEVEVGLPEGGARTTLGSEFSLMPGALVAGSRGGVLLVHCLDDSQDTTAMIRAEEDRLRSALGLERGR